jgi:tetratricopeptide (TPR) repeat protein
MVSISAVAEAHFNQGEVILEQAQTIALKGDEKRLQAAIAKKLKLMNEAKSIYEKVMAYRHPGWTIAAHAQLGLAYRDLADAVENAEVPRKLRRFPDAMEEYKTAMAERAAPIRDRAIGSYQKALEIARRDHWFNVYSERAEAAIAQMDLQDSSIKEFRIRPDRVQPNAGIPVFMEDAR